MLLVQKNFKKMFLYGIEVKVASFECFVFFLSVYTFILKNILLNKTILCQSCENVIIIILSVIPYPNPNIVLPPRVYKRMINVWFLFFVYILFISLHEMSKFTIKYVRPAI